ncbi:MAG: hypothetical protein JWL75_152 [Parcubacteria group bacterium]|nr:hypothetical protein [Parcubacteria group bacterium]
MVRFTLYNRHLTYMTTRLPLLSLVLVAGLLVQTLPVQASTPTLPVRVCHTFSANIRLGQQDAGANGEVAALQLALNNQGYFDAANLGTGHFGPLTFKSVVRFQSEHSVPATGYVGPLTRAALNTSQSGCGVTETNPANLYSVSPTSGVMGTTTVSVRGFGFSKTNSVLIDGYSAATNVPIASSIAISCTTDPSCHGGINQTIVFTLPEYVAPWCPAGAMCALYLKTLEPGAHTLTVRNDVGESNGIPFTVTK